MLHLFLSRYTSNPSWYTSFLHGTLLSYVFNNMYLCHCFKGGRTGGGWFVASHASPPNHISVPLPLACFPHADIYVASSTESSDLIPKLSRCYSYELVINEFRCHEAKIEESEKGQQSPGVEPITPLS